MVINIKHFIITIIAIFLSLGIGIFIGVVVDSQHLFNEQQKVLVAQIEEEFEGFKQRNYELMNKLEDYKLENNRHDKFIDTIYQRVINEEPLDLRVMIINMFADNNYLEIAQDLEGMGVKKTVEVNITEGGEENIEDMVQAIKDIFEKGKQNKEEITDYNMDKVISKLPINRDSLLLFYLNNIKYLDVKGEIYSGIDYVFLIDNGFKISDKNYGNLRKEIINLIRATNMPVMILEKSDTDSSSIPFYKELGISSVDNIDTKLGKMAMIMILRGKEGHFGEKETAENLLPDDFLVAE